MNTNDDRAARLSEFRHWLSASLDQIGDYILESFPAARYDLIQHRLMKDLSSCVATTPTQFRQWARKRIAEYANEVPLIERMENPSLSDVLAVAQLRPVQEDQRPFLYEQHGEKVFVSLQDSCGEIFSWVIPACWMQVAQALWPCHLRRMPRGQLYVSKKTKRQRYDGSWMQVDSPIHHIFLNAEAGARVDAADGNYLNYCDGNLSVHNALPATVQAREVPLSAHVSSDWIPAQSTRVPLERYSSRLNAHELEVLAWLRGDLD